MKVNVSNFAKVTESLAQASFRSRSQAHAVIHVEEGALGEAFEAGGRTSTKHISRVKPGNLLADVNDLVLEGPPSRFFHHIELAVLSLHVDIVLVRSVLKLFWYTIVECLDGAIGSLLGIKLDEAEALRQRLTLICVHRCTIIGRTLSSCRLELRQRDIADIAGSCKDLRNVLES